MIFTLEKLTNSIAGVLKQNYPETPVYSNPNQQGTKFPCFFIFFMPAEMKDEMDRRSRRILGIDIVYLTKRNIPDAYDQLTAVVDTLDFALDFIPYEGTEDIRTFDREWRIEDKELHYQFYIKAVVSVPNEGPSIENLKYEGGVKHAG
ncbi:MAG: hypothetical protein KH366_13275 [Clostridiaceae bacterium]|nr:hypothetical protein [Clostridiaceae bacterium]